VLPEIEKVSRKLTRIGRRLLNPTAEAFEGCLPEIASAVAALKQVQAHIPEVKERKPQQQLAIREDLLTLQAELGRVNALVQNAARLYKGWARSVLREDMSASNYTSAGKSIPAGPKHTVAVDG